jgi:hypothetical protein
MKHDFKKRSDGTIDRMADFGGDHNGPKCKICGTTFCEHCNPEMYDEECPGKPGFKFHVKTKYMHQRGLGVFYQYKTISIFLVLVEFVFDFSGMFPYAKDGDDL